jgi:hypothetical protein
MYVDVLARLRVDERVCVCVLHLCSTLRCYRLRPLGLVARHADIALFNFDLSAVHWMPTLYVLHDLLILPLRRDSTCCTRRCPLTSGYGMNSPINTLTLWGLDIVRSQRQWTPGSYLSTFAALPASRLKSHTSKVEQQNRRVCVDVCAHPCVGASEWLMCMCVLEHAPSLPWVPWNPWAT